MIYTLNNPEFTDGNLAAQELRHHGGSQQIQTKSNLRTSFCCIQAAARDGNQEKTIGSSGTVIYLL